MFSAAVFALPPRRAAKAAPELIDADRRHLSAVAEALERARTEVVARRAAARRSPGGTGQHAMDRDLEVHRLTSRLALLSRFGPDACLGRIVHRDGGTTYIGRLGLMDDQDRQLLVDWRSPAAEPFFGATHGDPMGLASRRRYRWTDGRVTDYWDEVFDAEGLEGHAALDDQSAFIASLGSARSARMRDVLGTIAADQDAVVRAPSAGTLVVDGGPGTGKTVVALHRTAYLLYSDPRLGHRRGGVLVIGPHRSYLDYVGDVLPSLGEEDVVMGTLRDLVPQGAQAREEACPDVARLKADVRMVAAIETAVQFYERAPTASLAVDTAWGTVQLDAPDWAEAFAVPEPGTPHNDARDVVWEALVSSLVDRLRDPQEVESDDGQDESPEGLRLGEDEFDAYGVAGPDSDGALRRAVTSHRGLRDAMGRAWPTLEPTDLVGDLWTVPAYLRLCAPHLTAAQVAALQRAEPDAWTTADLPLLDAAGLRLGDPEAARRRRRREAQAATQRARMADVVDDLIAHDDSDLGVMSMLRGQDLRASLADQGVDERTSVDRLVGPFAHVVVDEAQELTDAEWQMVLARCPSRSLTVVGDRAQARHGFTESWSERLGRVGLPEPTIAALVVNYRTPAEVMAEAEPEIRAALPGANVPTSIRVGGPPVRHRAVTELEEVLDGWLADHPDGVACVVGASVPVRRPRVTWAEPVLVKGLEFDLVVLVEPDRFGDGIEGAVDRYVAMTRATQQLVVLAGDDRRDATSPSP